MFCSYKPNIGRTAILIKNVTLSFKYQCPKTKEFVKVENFPLERTELYGDEDGYRNIPSQARVFF